ncbi:hypothetical protein GM921_00470 [Pedobacter sp. LMG 31464]|uniref:cAMP-binding domain of CRP or a regulatory subunit of cAMP-dependent protein kinases n=1 Tax=Pedobacter planticolens TaxID=2679964 RepID=A0A923DWW2_9SPHI|nr:Crp/Fnr family transcriptional regulator [Pedobacter planticolens]MBB2143943.1 hypothetical protein [Pedobacter planticolens]
MDHNTLFAGPNELRMISRRFLQEFTASAEQVHYKKGQQWLASGQQSRDILLIQQGAMASSQHYKQTNCITMLWTAHDIVFSGESFFHQQPSQQDIWFLSDATAYSINHRTVNALSAKYDDMHFILNFYLAEALTQSIRHSFMLTYHSPAEKFAYAQKEFHSAFNQLTREQQASFLNITRRTLSDLL